MSKKEELEKLLHGELDDIYCYNCAYEGLEEPCEWCHRKYMKWKPSDVLIHSIVEIAMRKEE